MLPIDDSVLSALNPDVRARLQELVGSWTISTPALFYRPVDCVIDPSASYLGGSPGSDNLDWPKDKTGKPMVFVGQVNFENANSCNQSLTPKSGVLMLFVSGEYKNFRAKDQSWFKLVYSANPDNAKTSADPGVPKLSPVAELVPQSVDCLRSFDASVLMKKLPELDSIPERDKVLTWFSSKSKRAKELLKDAHQICCSEDEQSREACVIAAFYANGISFDQARKADVHYKHLVDYASEWEVLWRLGGLWRLLPDETRQLFICISRVNLADFEFSKSIAVFL